VECLCSVWRGGHNYFGGLGGLYGKDRDNGVEGGLKWTIEGDGGGESISDMKGQRC
jgi:hypothetical protein